MKIEKIKKVIGLTLIGFSLFGGLTAISYQFRMKVIKRDFVFSEGNEGGASNAPIFYGLSAIAGAILLSSVKEDEVKGS